MMVQRSLLRLEVVVVVVAVVTVMMTIDNFNLNFNGMVMGQGVEYFDCVAETCPVYPVLTPIDSVSNYPEILKAFVALDEFLQS
jgi:hypothetical protein